VDGDGDLDVLSASIADSTIAWYENTGPVLTENGAAVVLDASVDISDTELDDLNGGTGDYHGTSVSLVRNGGASSEDVFDFNDGNGITVSANNLIKNGQIIASFDITSTLGELAIIFTHANGQTPTSTDVDNILRQLTYSNSSEAPPASVQIDWIFDDGNSGSQGTGGALQAKQITTINITQVNDAPINTVPSVQSVNEDTLLSITGISVNDVDGNLATTQLTVTNGNVNVDISGGATISGGANDSSTLTLSGTQAQINAALATLAYQGDLNYNASDTLTVLSTDSDGAPLSDSDDITITVSSINDAPIAVDDAVTATEDMLFTSTVDLDFNDTDLDGDSLSVVAGTFATAQGGSLFLAADGSYTYSPAANFNGMDTVNYTVTDGTLTNVASLTLTVGSVNDAPTGTTLVVAANEETLWAIDISANVADVDGTGDLSTTAVTAGPSNGTLVNNGDGTFAYTGDQDFVGTDSFTYTVEDNDGQV
jgi:hypothetical protein